MNTRQSTPPTSRRVMRTTAALVIGAVLATACGGGDAADVVEDLVEGQGTEHYVALALDEVGAEYVEDVLPEHALYFIARCVALYEENEL